MYSDPERQRLLSCIRAKRARLANPKRHQQALLDFRKGRPFAQTIYRARAAAKKHGVLSTLTEAEWQDKVTKADFFCWLCGRKTTLERGQNITLSLDHVIPLSEGGTNTIDNVEPACVQCNMHRKTMSLAELRAWISLVFMHICSINPESATKVASS